MNRLNVLIIATTLSCCSGEQKKQPMDNPVVAASHQLKVFTLTNKHGLKMTVTNFGGRIISLWVPDRQGTLGDIVLGYDLAAQYPGGNPYFGAMIGRFGNRIAKGRFALNGNEYHLSVNNGVNALHGGPSGFHNVYWEASQPGSSPDRLELTYVSKDQEEGYPGTMNVRVVYMLTDQNELAIDYHATTDKPTVVNLTHHSYFNLAGAGNGDILNHEISIQSDEFTPVGHGLIPTGERKRVEGTPFDFRQPQRIGKRIDEDDPQLHFGRGYDHNWILRKTDHSFALAATVREPVSGRVMEVWTTEPGLQFYSGNFLDGKDVGKGGKRYGYRGAFCLEAQHFPDSPNQPGFPSTVLKPGETYEQRTVYRFLR